MARHVQVLEAHANGLSADVVRRCMWQLCKAMCFIHKQDIVYRDIKPENLLIDPNGTLKLCDFGFARKVRPPGMTGARREGTQHASTSKRDVVRGFGLARVS